MLGAMEEVGLEVNSQKAKREWETERECVLCVCVGVCVRAVCVRVCVRARACVRVLCVCDKGRTFSNDRNITLNMNE